ncbi:MAG TPA: acyltransferase domain-containing protein, partial [Jatrophihabitantaceae bacterium]
GVDPARLGAAVRLAIDYADAAELAAKAEKALKAFASGNAPMWRMLKAQGVFLGRGLAPKVAFLYTGQGSQYANMLKPLRKSESIVADTFAEADRIMTPLLGKPLSSYVFSDSDDAETVARLDRQLLQTEITQPAVLTCDIALTRMLAAHSVRPDMVMGHSLGEYGALVAAGALDFSAALEAVSARGHEMASLDIEDNGAMAAVFGPLEEIERIVSAAEGYVVVANVNSNSQAVVGGATVAIERVIETFQAAGLTAQRIPVSHAFHTSIVAPVSAPLKDVLRRLDVHAPALPIVANVTGEFYPTGVDAEAMVDILGRQVASPVQFVKGLRTLYAAGARVFVEVGPKKALHGFVEDVFGPEHDDVLALFTNHPKLRDATAFNQALCGLYAAGLGLPASASPAPGRANGATPVPAMSVPAAPTITGPRASMNTDKYVELGKVFAEFLDRGRRIYDGDTAPAAAPSNGLATHEPVVVTGAALGLPGVERVFDDENIGRILGGQQFIDAIPHRLREAIVDKHITRLIKPESGEPSFVAIDDQDGVIKLAGRRAPFDVVSEFGVDEARDAALDSATRLAVGAGFDALRDAGIPLVMRYRTTTLGTQLPDHWGLPDELRDDTGIVFASAFPGYGEFAKDIERYTQDRGRRHELASLHAVRAQMGGDDAATGEVDRRIAELEHLLATEPFEFDRRFIFRSLSMGHSQFAELIGARGPNTQVNAACASTTQALCVAEDWIRTGRARRVVVIAADDVTGDALLPWIGSGFLASGAAATDDAVEDAAIPFDRRRHGMIVGMGAAAIVVESADAARERGVQPICEVLGAVTANSAFHGTRLDVEHVSQVMEQVLRQVESRGIDRQVMAPSTMFVSHETYTPARGGSAAAEISALRSAFGSAADDVVITNTKGFTGHAMGAGIEDIVAIKALETGIVPPVPNFKEPDPELGDLNLSTGGAYPVEYALRLAAGFGSQIAMAVLRWTPMPDRKRRSADQLGFRYRIADPVTWQGWLRRVSGQSDAELEVVQHRLRVVDKLAQPAAPAPAPVAVPTSAAEPEPVAPEPQPVAASGESMVDVVVSIVSEMTGYPPELLDL